MFAFLPYKISAALSRLEYKNIYEIRLRADRPIIVNYGCKNAFLTFKGISFDKKDGISLSFKEINDLLFDLCKRSVYAYADKLNKGFITLDGGIRVGLCGECVVDNGKITNIKNVTSLNIRIPHRIVGCADKLYGYFEGKLKNTLIISPPGAGKTTLLRGLAEIVSHKQMANVLVCDERNEIFPLLSSADTVDSIIYSPKKFAFENGLRAMTPDVIVTDELYGKEDAEAVLRAIYSGVRVFASIHGDGIEVLSMKDELYNLVTAFEIVAVLGEEMGKGTLKYVYGKDKSLLFSYDG